MIVALDTFRPVFIIGNSRSGTTLMSKILRRNADIHGFRELHFFEGLWAMARGGRALDRHQALELAVRLVCAIEDIREVDDAVLRRVRLRAESILADTENAEWSGYDIYRLFVQHVATENGVDRPCDQTPRNVFYLEALLAAYPHSRAVVMVRDPRAVMLSQKMKWKRRASGLGRLIPLRERLRRWMNYHPILTSLLWKSGMDAAEKVKGDPRVRAQRFEDLVADPAGQVAELCEFLGIAYSPHMLDVKRSVSPTVRGSGRTKGIDSTVAEQWRNKLTPVEVYWCEKVNGDRMGQYGYALVAPGPSAFALLFSLATMPLQSVLALLLNVGKSRNILKSIGQRFFRS